MKSIVRRTLARDVDELNVDWFGTMLISGLLDYSRTDMAEEIGAYAKAWLAHHMKKQPALSDAEYRRENGGCESRILREYTMPIPTYVGFFGLSFVGRKLNDYYGVTVGQKLCVDVADCILHYCGKNTLGLVLHDDREKGFTIPDVCYFVSSPLMNGVSFSADQGAAFQRDGQVQLKGFVDTFLLPDKGIAKTIYRDGRLGETCWIRASGWLLMAMVDTLEHMSPSAAEYGYFVSQLEHFAQGLAAYQTECGAYHLFIDEKDSPLETTGTAMIAYGLHKAVRLGWIGAEHLATSERAWGYVQKNIQPDGSLLGCYSGWALPAENRELHFDRPMNWMPGLVLIAGSEMLRG